MLKKSLGWEFDVIKFCELPEVANMPILVIGTYIMRETGIAKHLGLKLPKVCNWLREIELSYQNVPYHNNHHGADVVVGMYYWFTSSLFRNQMDYPFLCAAILAACAHDVGHDGRNNNFQISTRSAIAVRYNDLSPLENYHASKSFQITRKPECNWLEDLPPLEQNWIRSVMIEMILGTDMTYHNNLMVTLTKLVGSILSNLDDENPQPFLIDVTNGVERVPGVEDERKFVLKCGLHLADIGNPAKPLGMAQEWA